MERSNKSILIGGIALICVLANGLADAQGAPAVTASATSTAAVNTYPVLYITEVQLIRFGDGSRGGTVYVRGLESPAETTPAELVTIPDKLPPDKVLDLALVAPLSGAASGDLRPVEAHFEFSGSPEQIVGVRVRGNQNVLSTNGAIVDSAKLPTTHLDGLAGKRVATVRDGYIAVLDSTPPATFYGRIVKINDPLTERDVDPNRLTVFVSDNNVVLYARWN